MKTTTNTAKVKSVWLVCWYEDNYVRCENKEEAMNQIKELLDEGVPADDMDIYEAVERKLKATVEIV